MCDSQHLKPFANYPWLSRCENADDLSMLLWMALTVEGEGQSSGNDVGG